MNPIYVNPMNWQNIYIYIYIGKIEVQEFANELHMVQFHDGSYTFGYIPVYVTVCPFHLESKMERVQFTIIHH